MLALLLIAGAGASLLVIACPQLGLGLLVFSGRYSVGKFVAYLGEDSDAAGSFVFRVAPFFLALLVLSLVMRFATGKIAARISARSAAGLLSVFSFGLLLWIGCLYSPAESYGLEKALEYNLLTQFAFIAPLFLAYSFKDCRRLLVALLCIIVALAFLGLVPALAGGVSSFGRVAALGGGPIVFGRFMAIGLFIGFPFLILARQPLYRLGLLGVLALLAVACFLSGSRGVIIALVVAGLFYWGVSVGAQTRGSKFVRNTFLALIGVMAVGVVLLQLFPEILSGPLFRYQHLWQELPGSTSVSWRKDLIQSAVGMFAERPFAGYGTGAFAPVAAEVQRRVYPHNIFLEIAAELGTLGLFVFGCFLLLVVRSMISLIREAKTDHPLRLFGMAVSSCFVFYVVAAQFSGDLYDSRFVWLFAGMIFGLEGIAMRQKKSRLMQGADDRLKD